MKNKETKHEKVKRIMATIGLFAFVAFLIVGCICMAIGNNGLMWASMFTMVFAPIIIWALIYFYDKVHKDDEKEEDTDGTEK